ncbi:MAG: YkgJ family cysteine cluster protein [Labilithrix sp.]|nr:YkgJ family cysteine cluster protein [Labilithrix sp.]MCW5813878.1 YkgJ family cysteine cluster protein [Labilithrix sp.]
MPLTPLPGVPDPEGGDCVECGRCCHHGPRTVSLLEADERRMGERLLPIYTDLEDRPPYFRFVKNDGERCAGLDRTDPQRYPCAIYEVRPAGCREVEPGSPCCLEARALGHLGTSVEFKRPR